MEKLKHLYPLGVFLLFRAVCCLFLALQWSGNSFSWPYKQDRWPNGRVPPFVHYLWRATVAACRKSNNTAANFETTYSLLWSSRTLLHLHVQ